jgi:hypothetical protein
MADLYPIGYRFTLLLGRPFKVVEYQQRTGGDGEPVGPVHYVVENSDGDLSVQSHQFIRSMGTRIEDEEN